MAQFGNVLAVKSSGLRQVGIHPGTMLLSLMDFFNDRDIPRPIRQPQMSLLYGRLKGKIRISLRSFDHDICVVFILQLITV